jgi:hypothetical protein
MAKPNAAKSSHAGWPSIIQAVTSPLGFYVFIALVAEGLLGALMAKIDSKELVYVGAAMFVVFVILVSIVAYSASRNVGALMGWRPELSLEGAITPLEFTDRIVGYWWERITPDSASALSVVRITRNPFANTVRLDGIAYGLEGEIAANWDSVATCLHVPDRKVFYYWSGYHPPGDGWEYAEYEGFGEMTFRGPAERLDNGSAVFSSTKLADAKDSVRKTAVLRRLTAKEIAIIDENDSSKVQALVRSILDTEKRPARAREPAMA